MARRVSRACVGVASTAERPRVSVRDQPRLASTRVVAVFERSGARVAGGREDRVRGRGCPFCSGSRVCATNALSTRFPAIAAEGTRPRTVARVVRTLETHLHKARSRRRDRAVASPARPVTAARACARARRWETRLDVIEERDDFGHRLRTLRRLMLRRRRTKCRHGPSGSNGTFCSGHFPRYRPRRNPS